MSLEIAGPMRAVNQPLAMWHALATRLILSVDEEKKHFHAKHEAGVSVKLPQVTDSDDGYASLIWRFGFLYDELAEQFLRFCKGEKAAALLEKYLFIKASEPNIDKPQFGDGSWNALELEALRRAEKGGNAAFNLTSPFQLRKGGLGNLSFAPEVIFEKLALLVRQYEPDLASSLLADFSPRFIRVSKLHCATIEFPLRHGVTDYGIMGDVELEYIQPVGRAGFHLLTLIAPFAGLGAKTGFGLGSVELVSQRTIKRKSYSARKTITGARMPQSETDQTEVENEDSGGSIAGEFVLTAESSK